MKIEKAINQKHFRNNWQKVTLNILYTNSWLQNQIKAFLKPYEITTQQYNVLRILRGSYPKPLTTSIIRERMLDKMSDASRIVDRLFKKELVERKPCAADKRLVDVLITQKGLDLLANIDVYGHRLDFSKTQLSEEEALLLSDLLDKFRNN